MPLIDTKYIRDVSFLKVFGCGECKKIKVITMKYVRNSGIVDSDISDKPITENDEKLSDNISRAKSKIFELAFCNPWQYFFTGTLDKSKYDRTDLERFHHDFTQFIRDRGKKYGKKIDFLLIPELHTDGESWHMHGFLSGIDEKELCQFSIGDKMSKSLAKKVYQGEIIFNWISYSKKFGFCDLEPIKNQEAVSKYITKYINKNLETSVKKLNAHLYYHSRGLQFATTIKKGIMSAHITPQYENDYCSVSWLDYSEELLQNLINSFSS